MKLSLLIFVTFALVQYDWADCSVLNFLRSKPKLSDRDKIEKHLEKSRLEIERNALDKTISPYFLQTKWNGFYTTLFSDTLFSLKDINKLKKEPKIVEAINAWISKQKDIKDYTNLLIEVHKSLEPIWVREIEDAIRKLVSDKQREGDYSKLIDGTLKDLQRRMELTKTKNVQASFDDFINRRRSEAEFTAILVGAVEDSRQSNNLLNITQVAFGESLNRYIFRSNQGGLEVPASKEIIQMRDYYRERRMSEIEKQLSSWIEKRYNSEDPYISLLTKEVMFLRDTERLSRGPWEEQRCNKQAVTRINHVFRGQVGLIDAANLTDFYVAYHLDKHADHCFELHSSRLEEHMATLKYNSGLVDREKSSISQYEIVQTASEAARGIWSFFYDRMDMKHDAYPPRELVMADKLQSGEFKITADMMELMFQNTTEIMRQKGDKKYFECLEIQHTVRNNNLLYIWNKIYERYFSWHREHIAEMRKVFDIWRWNMEWQMARDKLDGGLGQEPIMPNARDFYLAYAAYKTSMYLDRKDVRKNAEKLYEKIILRHVPEPDLRLSEGMK